MVGGYKRAMDTHLSGGTGVDGYNLLPTWVGVDMKIIPVMVGGLVMCMKILGGYGCGFRSTSAHPAHLSTLMACDITLEMIANNICSVTTIYTPLIFFG